jgi:amidase
MDRRQFLLKSAASAILASYGKFSFGSSSGGGLAGELAGIDGLALAAKIRKGDISATEALEAAILRIEQMNGPTNAVVTKIFEQALERASQGVGEGPFAGVPYLLKDLLDYQGVRLTQGSKLFKDNVSDWTPPYVAATEAAGLNIMGKTNTPEFGLLATTESVLLGACHNPWNLQHSSGGSSGGAAAAVASGMVPLAQASDGGGSIRIPASCCGLFGLKPSRGRMLQTSKQAMPGDIGVRHCVSRSVRDSAMLFSKTEMQGKDALLTPTGFVGQSVSRRLKIAFSTMSYYGEEPHPEVKASLEKTAALCADLGHEIIEVKNPVDGEQFVSAFLTVWASGPANLKAMVESQTKKPAEDTGLLEPWTLGLAEYFLKKPKDALAEALGVFNSVTLQTEKFFKDYDVWLTPVLNDPPPRLGEQSPDTPFETLYNRTIQYVAYTPLHNAAGIRSVASLRRLWGRKDVCLPWPTSSKRPAHGRIDGHQIQ